MKPLSPKALCQEDGAVKLAAELVRCPSITPQEGGALDLLQACLEGLGFTCERMPFAEKGWQAVDNLYARLGTAKPFLSFAGHSDVVPPGEIKNWRVPPFAGAIEEGRLVGRGVSDMKGAIAAFVAAAARFVADEKKTFTGSLGLLITGDEEGPAINGTDKMLATLAARGEMMDACLVGEPTNPNQLGEEIKIGRRGSLNGTLTLAGEEGHSAWPSKANNPLPHLVKVLARIEAWELDKGSDYFVPSHLVITSIDTGNQARNVIPAKASAKFNIRFNDHHRSESLKENLNAICREALEGSNIKWALAFLPPSQCFYNPPGMLAKQLRSAVREETGHEPAFTTTGGTSDARFLQAHVKELAEFGLVGATMHKDNEEARVEDIVALSRIYERVLRNYFAPPSA